MDVNLSKILVYSSFQIEKVFTSYQDTTNPIQYTTTSTQHTTNLTQHTTNPNTKPQTKHTTHPIQPNKHNPSHPTQVCGSEVGDGVEQHGGKCKSASGGQCPQESHPSCRL